MTLPPDRGHITTEQPHAETQGLDLLSTTACVELLAGDHMQAIEAVQLASSSIASFIDDVHQRVADGGRLIYIGSGTSGRLGVLDAAECPPTFQSDPGLIIGLIAGGDEALRKSSESAEDDPEGARQAFEDIHLNAPRHRRWDRSWRHNSMGHRGTATCQEKRGTDMLVDLLR